MSRMTEYAALDTPEDDDILVIVDVSDTSMASTGTTKKITVADLGAGAGAVASVNGHTGPVVLDAADVGADASGAAATAQGNAETFATGAVGTEAARALAAEALLAPKASPALTGTPTAPTQTTGDSSTKIATDAFVGTAVAAETARAVAAEALALLKSGGTMSGPIAMGASKITGLANGSGAQDAVAFGQLGSAALQPSSAFDTAGAASAAQSAAIAASLPTLAVAQVSASATLAVNTITQVTAASNLTMPLPSPVAGALIVVEREAASTGTVAITGNIRGAGASTITLQLPSESEMFLGTGSTWDPVAGHKTLASLDSRYSEMRGLLGTGMIPAASNSQLNPGPTFLSGGGTFCRIKVQAFEDAGTFRLVYWNGLNVGTLNPPEQAGPNAIKVRASIEIGNGAIAPYRYVPTTTAYAGGTTYVVGSRVSSGGIYYVSLQAANTGNTPVSSPAFWAPILNTGATYSAAAAYVAGDLVGLPSGAAYYIAIASTTGNTPPNASFWALVSSSSTAYDATITYNPQDQVTSAGLSWVCLQAALAQAPAAGSAYWQQVFYYPVPFAGQDANRDVLIAPGEIMVSEPLGISPGLAAGQFFYVNTMTQPVARTDAVTGTSASATVTDASITAADQGRALAAGTGIPAGTYVGTVTPATSFLMSSSPYVQVNVNATANFASCQILGAPNQGSYPRANTITWAAGDIEQHSSAGTAPDDYTLAGPTTRVSNADGTTSFCPVAVLGLPSAGTAGRKVIAIAGDSIALGTGDTALLGGDEALGWTLRMLADSAASPSKFTWTYLRMARGSSAGTFQYGPGISAMASLAAGCTHVVDQWIVNDLGLGGITLGALQASAVARWTAWAKLGLKVIGCTSTPNATSTDSYATVANQTPVTNFGAASLWSQYNAWILGVPSPLSGVIDVASVVVNTASGGGNAIGTVWQPGMISLAAGSPHPSLAGHIAIAQSVNPPALFA